MVQRMKQRTAAAKAGPVSIDFRHDSKSCPSRFRSQAGARVDDLDALLEALKAEGVRIDPHREGYDYGRFAWIMDPEGNRIELWEPPKGKKS
jgi:predicted enzyme related to lactoylglutathione lyase